MTVRSAHMCKTRFIRVTDGHMQGQVTDSAQKHATDGSNVFVKCQSCLLS